MNNKALGKKPLSFEEWKCANNLKGWASNAVPAYQLRDQYCKYLVEHHCNANLEAALELEEIVSQDYFTGLDYKYLETARKLRVSSGEEEK